LLVKHLGSVWLLSWDKRDEDSGYRNVFGGRDRDKNI
jgi:hypothetical protein